MLQKNLTKPAKAQKPLRDVSIADADVRDKIKKKLTGGETVTNVSRNQKPRCVRRKQVTDMQILKLYAVRDSKAEVFNAPFALKTHGEAERSFREAARDTNSMVGKYPEDYDLYYLGEYDDSTGKMKLLDSPQHVAKAVQLVPGNKTLRNAEQDSIG